jgi:hypothetical protein
MYCASIVLVSVTIDNRSFVYFLRTQRRLNFACRMVGRRSKAPIGRVFFVVARIIPVALHCSGDGETEYREVDVCVGAAASCFLVFGADFSSSRCGSNRERTGKADGRLRR